MFGGNKVVSKREEEKRREKHEFRLKTMKSTIDAKIPASLVYKVPNTKKIQLLEGNSQSERCTEIERENRILYEKMLKIRTKSPILESKSLKKSLNKEFRKRRLLEIEKDNTELTERIKRRESAYRLEKYNTERKETEKILNTISEFPLFQNMKTKRSTTSSFSKKTPRKLNPLKDKLIHRQGKIINNKSYLIEIYKDPDTYKILAFDIESPEKLATTLSVVEFENLMKNCKDYAKIANFIEIQNNELVFKYSRPVSAFN